MIKLVSNWKTSWKWASMQLNAVASVVIAYLLTSPEVLLQTLNQLPPELRAYVPPAAGFFLFAIVALARLWKQNHKEVA